MRASVAALSSAPASSARATPSRAGHAGRRRQRSARPERARRRRCSSSALGLAVDAEQLQHRRQPHVELVAAEQRPALRDDVPPDGHAALDRVGDPLRVERRGDAAHEHVGGPGRVQDVALPGRARPDHRDHVIVAGDGDARRRAPRAARRRRARPACRRRRARRGSRPARRARPAPRATRRGRRSDEHAGARGQRQLGDVGGAERARHPLGHAEPAHRLRGAGRARAASASLLSVHSAEAGTPVSAAKRRRAERRTRSRAPRRPRGRRATRSPARPARRAGRAARRSRPCRRRRRPPRRPAGESASARAATAIAVRATPCGIDLGAGRDRRPRRPLAGLAELLARRRRARAPCSTSCRRRCRGAAAASLARWRRRSRAGPPCDGARRRRGSCRRSAAGRPTASFHSERPAMKPSAPPAIDARSWSQNASWSTPGREHGPRDVDRVGHAPAPLLAARVLELEHLRAALLQEHGAVDDEVLLARGELLGALVVEAVGHQLHHAQQVGAARSPRARRGPCRRCSRRGPRGRRAGTPSPWPRWRRAPARRRRRGPGISPERRSPSSSSWPSASIRTISPTSRGQHVGVDDVRAATRRGRAGSRWRRGRRCRRGRT